MKWLRISLTVFLGISGGQAALVVVPNESASTEGNSFMLSPFNPLVVGDSMRYQQVYDASQFAAVAQEGELILAIGIRIDSGAGEGFSALLRDVQINLSTTQKSADRLSANFSENVGFDDTVAFRGQLEFGWGYSVGSWPQPFSESIPSGWFFYRPSAGNLLLDIRVFTYSNSLPATAFDASSVEGDGISIVSSTNVNSAVGARSTSGLVTLFHTFPTPELSLSRTNDDLRFNWLDYPRGYLLETRDCLDCASVWQLVAEPGTTNGYTREVLVPLDPGPRVRFYRLSWTPPPGRLKADPRPEQTVLTSFENH